MQAMIESAATYTQSIYKCKGCPPQNQCTVLQFFIRSKLVWGGHSCPPPLILILISERLPGLVVRHTCSTTPLPATCFNTLISKRLEKNGEINKPRKQRQCGPECQPGHDYPFTLTREKDSIARPVVGLPMESAGRKVVKVVKINMFFFNWGSNGSSSLESERMR